MPTCEGCGAEYEVALVGRVVLRPREAWCPSCRPLLTAARAEGRLLPVLAVLQHLVREGKGTEEARQTAAVCTWVDPWEVPNWLPASSDEARPVDPALQGRWWRLYDNHSVRESTLAHDPDPDAGGWRFDDRLWARVAYWRRIGRIAEKVALVCERDGHDEWAAAHRGHAVQAYQRAMVAARHLTEELGEKAATR